MWYGPDGFLSPRFRRVCDKKCSTESANVPGFFIPPIQTGLRPMLRDGCYAFCLVFYPPDSDGFATDRETIEWSL